MRKPNPIPKHLKKYVVAQNYSRYTAEDQAVWRYIMRQLKSFLQDNAHPCYKDGLKKTGISTERIPKITDMNKMLNKFGWGAIPVSGFIPPAAFMEFQSLGYLPIASEMRSVQNIQYTPAPDIVHEAAGHAPILIDKNFSDYLKSYADVASHAIISKEDMDLYEAIRVLSDAKENSATTPAKVRKLEDDVNAKSKAIQYESEAGLLGRMNWWTAEYGLIGGLNNPKIFGAGLLSSIGESRQCLEPRVKKIPFDLSCLKYTYDITEPQPQLFVTPSFKKLKSVLNDLGSQMAYSIGGESGLNKAKKSETINTVELNSGLQISGKIDSYKMNGKTVNFIKLSGPTQISYGYTEITGHGKKYHSHGYSSPVGKLKGIKKCLSKMSMAELKKIGIQKNKTCVLEYESGIIVTGQLRSILRMNSKNLIMSFKNCSVVHNNELMFHPSWGNFDLACCDSIPSVFGGPADRAAYGDTTDFKAKKIKIKKLSATRSKLMKLYSEAAQIRNSKSSNSKKIETLFEKFKSNHSKEWLLGLEIYELSVMKKSPSDLKNQIFNFISNLDISENYRSQLNDGIKLSNKVL